MYAHLAPFVAVGILGILRQRASDTVGSTEGHDMIRRRMWPALALGLGGILMAGICSAQEPVQLGGKLFIAGKTAIDPPPDEPKNSHAYMTVSGPAALRMYRAMTAKDEPNLCETGKRIKRAGPLSCSLSRDGRSATCDFSVDLRHGALDEGRPC